MTWSNRSAEAIIGIGFVQIGYWICCLGAIVPLIAELVHLRVQLGREFHLQRVSATLPRARLGNPLR